MRAGRSPAKEGPLCRSAEEPFRLGAAYTFSIGAEPAVALAAGDGRYMGDITALLAQAGAGDRAAFDAIFERLYPELQRLARARLAGHERSPEMQTTALVHECYLKLLQASRLTPQDRAHFLGYAAHVMRSVMVDTVRANGRLRRGGDALHVTLITAVADSVSLPEDEILDVDSALKDLGKLDQRLVRVVEMRYFAGMTDAEIAAALGVTDRTVRRDWEKARLLLATALKR